MTSAKAQLHSGSCEIAKYVKCFWSKSWWVTSQCRIDSNSRGLIIRFCKMKISKRSFYLYITQLFRKRRHTVLHIRYF